MLRSMLALLVLRFGVSRRPPRIGRDGARAERANDAHRLRELLQDIYHAGVLNPLNASDGEHMRLLDVVLDAAEGRAFDRLGLPFPREHATLFGATVTLPALPAGWVYVATPADEALLDSGPPYTPQ